MTHFGYCGGATKFQNNSYGTAYGEKIISGNFIINILGDKITIILNSKKGTLAFARNGKNLGNKIIKY
jgi:hypothetical protein